MTDSMEARSRSKTSMQGVEEDNIVTIPLDRLKVQLGASPEGLSQGEAEKRIEEYGYNEFREEQKSALREFLSFFWGPIAWMIEVAAVLSAVVGHWEDFAIILTLLFVNAVVGFWEEHQADNTIAALKEKLALDARVKRDNVWKTRPARELVPGDLIRVRIGDIVPADARILGGGPVRVDQSALTGESLPVTRETGQAIFSGSIIEQGEIEGLVYATGQETYFGRTAKLAEDATSVSHFQRAVLKIGDYLIVLAMILVSLIVGVSLSRGDNILTAVEFALVLTVAAIPVAMPTVLTITMAVGARFLAAKQAIVSRLASIEELAGMDILCSDKTGTLTQNKLTLGDPFCIEGTEKDDLILNAALASRAEDNDPIDLVVLKGLKEEMHPESFEIVHFQPFDPVSKRTEATVKSPQGHPFKVSKGAPQVILGLSSNRKKIEDKVSQAVDAFAKRGFRSLGVARTDEKDQWQFLGVIPLYDPPREDSKETIRSAKEMGIDIKMITGDQIAIGKEIARQLDLGTNILDAGAFEEPKHHQAGQLDASIEDADGFAQVFPEHKYHIVEMLQQRGHIVGMTGDGVNDAPALKKADTGIAVSGATDAARDAADMVLLTPGLSVIIDALKESRKIFQRMNSYAIYRIAETIRVLLFMTLSILVFNFYPITAVMIVLLALLNDGAILSIAYDHVRYSDKPEKWDMPVIMSLAAALGIFGVIASFGLFYLGQQVFQLSPDVIQSMMYLKLSIAGHLTIFITRTKGPFWSFKPSPILLGAVAGTQLLATLIAVFGIFMTPIGWQWGLFVWGYAFLWFLINDRVKLAIYKILDQNDSILVALRKRV